MGKVTDYRKNGSRLLVGFYHQFMMSLIVLVMWQLFAACRGDYAKEERGEPVRMSNLVITPDSANPLYYHKITEDIRIKRYFSWVRDVVSQYDSLVPYELSEQLLIHANPWLIDSFAATDYYSLMEQGVFVYDQPAWVVLHKGDTLEIPAIRTAKQLEVKLSDIRIDINLPEYRLRLLQGDSLLHSFPVRIGQNRKKYLPTEGRTVDLRTVIGKGFVYQIIYAPKYINFNTGATYTQTNRDDGKRTLMPLIPTLETEINGVCYGQLIHPTTNPNTLGKAYSHGCIGTREGDAWRIYFHSRAGTPVEIRYDLNGVNEQGDTVMLEDVYGLIN